MTQRCKVRHDDNRQDTKSISTEQQCYSKWKNRATLPGILQRKQGFIGQSIYVAPLNPAS